MNSWNRHRIYILHNKTNKGEKEGQQKHLFPFIFLTNLVIKRNINLWLFFPLKIYCRECSQRHWFKKYSLHRCPTHSTFPSHCTPPVINRILITLRNFYVHLIRIKVQTDILFENKHNLSMLTHVFMAPFSIPFYF